ncbi:hypothetical protein IP87_02910 [beta proteobacterium AAP121]|nr:hypothetical protein IP80_11350 [beta proteobacterium AAP65]KPG00315.1 hypothetical protein IP87_02910 [beta proteobacterium AAP121]
MKYFNTVTFTVDGTELLAAGLTLEDLQSDMRDIFGTDNVVQGPRGTVCVNVVEDFDWTPFDGT